MIREKLYGMAELALESYIDECGSKFPVGSKTIDDQK